MVRRQSAPVGYGGSYYWDPRVTLRYGWKKGQQIRRATTAAGNYLQPFMKRTFGSLSPYMGYTKKRGVKRRRVGTKKYKRIQSGGPPLIKDIEKKIRKYPSQKRPVFMSGGRRYMTTGYLNKFKGVKRHGKNIYELRGSSYHAEVKIPSDGADGIVVGHSTAIFAHLMKSLGRALLRPLLSNCREYIKDWESNAALNADQYQVTIKYNTDRLVGGVSSSVSVLGGAAPATYFDLASSLADRFMGLVTTSNDLPRFQSIHLELLSGITWEYEIDLTMTDICLSVVSLLTLQNLTESATGVHSTDDVRANPLIGRVYFSKSNAFIEKDEGGSITTNNFGDGGMAGGAAQTLTHLHEPSFYSNVSQTGKVMLGPGEIKKSTLTTRGQYRFNRLMSVLKRYLAVNANVTTAVAAFCPFGVSKLYEFEHVNKSTSDPSVAVDGEINYFISSYCKYKVDRSTKRINA